MSEPDCLTIRRGPCPPLYRYIPRPGKEPGTKSNPVVVPGSIVVIRFR